jgi:hypothetical protein
MTIETAMLEKAIAELEQSLTFTLLRHSGPAHPTDQLAALIRASAAFSHDAAFNLEVERGRLDPVSPTAEWLAARFATGDAFHREFGGVTLASPSSPPLTLTYARDLTTPGIRYDQVRITVPWGPAAGDLPAWRQDLSGWVEALAQGFEAEVAWVATHDLVAIVHEAAAAGEEVEAPPGVQPVDVASGAPADLVARFTGLLAGHEIDRAAVPEVIGWINVWSDPVIERLGREKVMRCSWVRSSRLGSRAHLFVASNEPPDLAHLASLRAVADLVDCVDLPKAQRTHRL